MRPKARFTGILAAGILLANATPRADPRARTIEDRLIAPCCWAEPVSLHRSEVAAAMRSEIERMVAEGRSDREILDHYVTKYGRRVLIEPEGVSRVLIYAAPAAALLIGAAVILRFLLRACHRGPAGAT